MEGLGKIPWGDKNCRFLCKLKKVLTWVGDHVPGAVGDIAKYASMGMDAVGIEGKINDDSLTAAETTILDSWEEKYLIPFSLNLFAIFNTNIANSALPVQTRLQFANEFILKIAAFARYYVSNEKSGLSANALDIRNKYILAYFDPYLQHLYQDITFSTFELTSVEDEVANYDLSPVVVKTVDFAPILSFSSSVFKTSGEITPSPEVVVNNPPKVITVVTENGNVISSTSTSSSTSIIKVIAFLGISVFALKYAFAKEK